MNIPAEHEVEVSRRERDVRNGILRSAIVWTLTRFRHTSESPIVGADPVVKTLLELYQDDLEAARRAVESMQSNAVEAAQNR